MMLRLYGRRKGRRPSPLRARLMAERFPDWRIDWPESMLDPKALFATLPSSIWLEVGFGAGEHLVHQARIHPSVGFIGCDVFEEGIARLVAWIDRYDLDNIRIFDNDARLLMPRLKASSIDRAFLLFPDPWPKSRHASRRFLTDASLAELGRLMPYGAQLRMATDDPLMAAWMLVHVERSTCFQWIAEEAASWQRPQDWIETRYERRSLAAGRQPAFFVCTKMI